MYSQSLIGIIRGYYSPFEGLLVYGGTSQGLRLWVQSLVTTLPRGPSQGMLQPWDEKKDSFEGSPKTLNPKP